MREEVPQGARLSDGGAVRSLFGQCPNRPCNFLSGASLTKKTGSCEEEWGRVFGFELNPVEGIIFTFDVFIFISTFSNFTFTFHIFTLTVLVLLSPFFLLLGCVRRNEEECLVCE